MTPRLLAGLAVGLLAMPSHAAIVVTISQVGSDVQVLGSGSLKIDGLGSPGPLDLPAGITAGVAAPPGALQSYLAVGSPVSQPVTWYSISATPFTLGSGAFQIASQGSGNKFGISSEAGGSTAYLAVPAGYASGSSLSGASTYLGTTIAGLGLTAGTYVWTWGSGASADSFTLTIGETTTAPPVPLPAAAWLLLSGLAGLGVVGRRRRADAA